MKKYIWLILLSVTTNCLVSFAQVQPQATNNKVIPSPPDIATLMKFTETPVTYFNGTADISIPIYNIKCGDLSFPITINYNTSGIKVTEEAGWVGLGWNISAIGAINESLEESSLGPTPKLDVVPPSYNGYNANSAVTNIIARGRVFPDSKGQCQLFNFNVNGNYDPNIITMSANGMSGKFMIPNGRMDLVSIDGKNIKLISTHDHEYEALMPDGAHYYFNKVVVSASSDPTVTPVEVHYHYSTYLSKIVSPSGKTITFKYSDIIPSDALGVRYQTWATDDAPGVQNRFNPTDWLKPGGTVQNIYVTEIDFDNGYVKFQSGLRDDNGGRKLENITVYHQGEALPFKTISFNYDYFAPQGGNFGDYTTEMLSLASAPNSGNDPYPEAYKQERLKLTSVKVDSDPPYSFAYDATLLPYKTSWAQDIWGYFNGSLIKSLLPNYNDLQFTGDQIPLSIIEAQTKATLGNRSSNFNYTKAGSLTKVTYPSGGYTVYQYEPNTFDRQNSAQNVIDKLVSITATGNGTQQQEFDVPATGFVTNSTTVNPSILDVKLFCQGGQGTCAVRQAGVSGGGNGYVASSVSSDNYYGLYALLEYFDPNSGTWQLQQQNIFDWQNPVVSNGSYCGAANLLRELVPGHYRITAHFPEDQQGSVTGARASISLTYKVYSTSTSIKTYNGPGLRIAKITNYAADGGIADQRAITYSGGQLMTPTIFYRYNVGLLGGPQAPYCVDATNNDDINTIIASNNYTEANSCSSGADVVANRNFAILYSNPVLPYSYSANGSLFGYATVCEQKVDQNGNDQGRTVYDYNIKPDVYTNYGLNLPGTPSTPYLDNGTLKDVQEQKKLVGNSYTTIHSSKYEYEVGTSNLFWGFKIDYLTRFRADGSLEYGCGLQDPSSIYLHFYPIKTGHVNMVGKVEQTFNGAVPLTETTAYTYNSINQQHTATTDKSDGNQRSTEISYPVDYTSSGDFTSDMRAKNFLDYPIESLVKVNGLTTNGYYNEYLAHDNIITPLAAYTLTTATPVAVIPSTAGNARDPHYELRAHSDYDSHGNLVRQYRADGTPVVYLWSYSNEYPVAEIKNADYGSMLNALANVGISAETISNKAAPDPSDLPAIRAAIANQLPNAQVTTYTYQPLVGMTSMTDSRGQVTTYEYDSFQRLRYIKDQQGKVLKQLDYHYQNQ